MAVAVHKNRLRSFIQTMYDDGIVKSTSIHEGGYSTRLCCERAVTSFCLSCINLFSTLTDQIYKQKVDFQKVHVLARELYARTSGVGAENVKCACAELLHARELKDKSHATLIYIHMLSNNNNEGSLIPLDWVAA